MKLYEIAQELREMLEVADNEDYKDTIEGLHLEFADKVDSVACYIKELQAEAEAIKAEEKALADRRKAKEDKVESLKQYLCNEMSVAGTKKVETARNVLSIRKTAPSVKIDDEKALIEIAKSSECMDWMLSYKEPTLNKTAIKDFLKDGGVFEGVRLEAGESLVMK